MKFFVAGLQMETNTFSPIPTGIISFEESGIFRGSAAASPATPHTLLPQYWLHRAVEEGHSVAEGVIANAKPAGRIQKSVYESLRDEMLSDLERASPVDICLLSLHGAMSAEGYDDCEGDMLTRARAIVGRSTVIGVEIDPHCHATPAMFDAADLILAYKEYPHTDVLDRGVELFDLAVRTANGELTPTTAFFDCRMVNSFHTTRQPMRGFVDHMMGLEDGDHVLSVNFGHSFPWGDVPDMGAKTWVITNGDQPLARRMAEKLCGEIHEIREEVSTPLVDIDTAIDLVEVDSSGLTVLSDTADNAGGGAPSDSTFILCRLLERGVRDAVSGVYWDPVVAKLCAEAGRGAIIDVRLGGKVGPVSGPPLDLRVEVMNVIDDHRQLGPDGAFYNFGLSAWLRCGGVDIVVGSMRQQVYHPHAFTNLGIELDQARLVVVKSSQHFHAGFAPLARRILYVTTPGAMNHDYAAIPYKNRPPHYWPRVADPFAEPAV